MRARQILIVDDESLVLRSMSRVLTRAGWQVTAVRTAPEALAALDRCSFDVLIVDYDLGDHDGLVVLQHARDRAGGSVRVLMTGHDDLPLVVAAVNRGEAFKVLRKPFQQVELIELLNEALRSFASFAEASRSRNDERFQDEMIALRQALAPGAVRFAVQPILSAVDGATVGHEALLRPHHPSFPGPVELLLAVERQAQVRLLGQAVLTAAAPLLGALPGLLFVNLHPDQLAEPDELLAALAPLAPLATRVVLEITERSRLQEHGAWERSVDLARAQGFSFAVDDLGAGYSALGMLADLRPDYIKLDRSLVAGLHLSSRKQRLVQLLATFGEATGACVIAEGIELDEELVAVRGCGVSLLQGYLLGSPRPVVLGMGGAASS